MAPAKIFVVDQHPVVRQGLTGLILQEPDLSVCGEAESPDGAFDAIIEAEPDLVIIDLTQGESSSLSLIRSLRRRFRDLAILALTMHEESFYAERALAAGALGYVTQKEAGEKIVTAIRKLLDGELYVSEELSPRLLRRLVGRTSPLIDDDLVAILSARERQVFQRIGEGRGSREIAEELQLSIKTVESYCANIKQKLGLENGRQLVQQAILWVLGMKI